MSELSTTATTRADRRAFVEFTGQSGRLTHLPGLDGLRGLAVLGVVLFHADLGFLVGGYLGVSTFFTLSGFLIMSLLLSELERSGTVDRRGFWSRRFRRLLPASIATLFVISTVFAVAFAEPGQLQGLRDQVWAALAQVANWQLILSGSSYADLFSAPSPLVHFWSLAIEEQFYLFFPLLVAGLWRLGGRSPRLLAPTLGGLAVLSALEPLIFEMSADRVYFGTDTRGAELLAGALLALAFARPGLRRRLAFQTSLRSAVTAVAVLAGVWQLYWWITLPQTSDVLQRGGLALYGLLSCVVITAACLPGGALTSVFSNRILGYLGSRSYGIYLIHWPVMLAVRQSMPAWSPWLTAAVAISVSLLLAEASFRWIEEPIRRRRSPLSTHFVRNSVIAVAAVAVAAAVIPALLDDGDQELDFESALALQDRLAEERDNGSVSTTSTPPPDSATPPTLVPTPTIGVYGDSTGLLMGMGLHAYGDETGRLVLRPGDGRLGCGVARFSARDFDGWRDVEPECRDWPEGWSASVEADDPDVAVLITASWELTDVELPDGHRAAIGDPAVDDFIRDELQLAVDILGAEGALVVLVQWPTFGRAATERDVSAGAQADPARMERLHAIIDEVADANPGNVAVLALGSRLSDRVEDRDLRPDGVHISAEQALVLFREGLGDELLGLWDAHHRAEQQPAG